MEYPYIPGWKISAHRNSWSTYIKNGWIFYSHELYDDI